MKIAKTEHIAVTEQPTRQLPLPINPSQPPPVANFQQQVTSAYASLPPSLPPVPQATLPVAGTTAHDGPPPPTAQPTAAYPSGSYQQAPGSTAYSATQSYQPQQQPPPQTTGFSFPNAQASQPTASTSYSQKPGYDYTQTQAYGTQDSYPPSYNAPPTQASFGSYSQENTNTNQGSYNTPTRQYPTQYQQSGQYPANQNTVPPPNYPAQPPTPQPQHTLPPSQAAPTTAPPSLLAQQPYSMAGRGGGSTYPTTPPKNYPPPQTYNTPTRYDTPPPSLPQQQRGGPPTPGGMVPVSGALPPTPVTPGQVPPGSYPPQVWAPRGPPPRGPPPPNTAGSLSSLATVRITGRTDQRRSSTGKTQPPFFR
uniref:Extensin-like isoform X1 n=1 Tax=Saccoglossus kowalevskii TaxID=10224 RepID=A0ABM0MGZ4_SACKO|nr:PREDICTED: extensin-like isoform X1 [Saccoglossus kowalevskii]XP_006819286.1 PREDICTED: extensin-like isoform X2 [Saccoglossus kowalevskii]XP_006819287.1 PREDICTED: extensin-like isoform X3 [Saccoglossus kowalevskii]